MVLLFAGGFDGELLVGCWWVRGVLVAWFVAGGMLVGCWWIGSVLVACWWVAGVLVACWRVAVICMGVVEPASFLLLFAWVIRFADGLLVSR